MLFILNKHFQNYNRIAIFNGLERKCCLRESSIKTKIETGNADKNRYRQR